MSERASLLRRRIALGAGAVFLCAAMLASSPAARAAGGAPVPVPDEPPPGLRIQTSKQPTAGQQPARARVSGEQASGAFVPTPDAPGAQKGASGSTTAPAPVTRTRSDVQPTAGAAPAAPSVSVTRRRDERMPAPAQARAAESKPPQTRVQRKPAPVTPRFEELFRPALPVATRLPPPDGSSVEIALLLAAAALLGGAAAGGAVIGLVARRLAGAA